MDFGVSQNHSQKGKERFSHKGKYCKIVDDGAADNKNADRCHEAGLVVLRWGMCGGLVVRQSGALSRRTLQSLVLMLHGVHWDKDGVSDMEDKVEGRDQARGSDDG